MTPTNPRSRVPLREERIVDTLVVTRGLPNLPVCLRDLDQRRDRRLLLEQTLIHARRTAVFQSGSSSESLTVSNQRLIASFCRV